MPVSKLQSLLGVLNGPQLDAVKHDKHTSVIACPGSGKTRVLQTKACYILETAPASVVAAVTFTRDSADEIAHRIADAVSSPPKNRLITGTFHRTMLKQLRAHSPGLRLLSMAEQRSLLARARAAVAPKHSMEECEHALEHMKSSLDPKPRKEWEYLDSAIFERYQHHLVSHDAIDFADIMSLTVRHMANGRIPTLRVSHLLVDEYQDTDGIQAQWIRHHIDAGVWVTVVGDDDQSVYGWRHARGYQGLRAFQEITGAKVVTLDTNYRCYAEILEPAARLIGHNVERMPKQLRAGKGPGGGAEIIRYASEPEEVNGIVSMTADEPDRWALIARTNILLDDYEAALRRAGVPYNRVGSGSMWNSPPIQTFLMLLASLSDGSGIGLEHALTFSGGTESDVDLIRGSKAFDCRGPAPEGLSPIADTFLARLATWRGLEERGNLTALILSAKTYLLPSVHRKKQDFFLKAVDIFSTLKGDLAGRLRTVLSNRESEKDAKGVTLMTMHGSKGLEFERVVVVRVNAGVVPSAKSTDEPEERRLFYVGMTRAKERLVITHIGDALPSPFLAQTGLPLPQ